MQGKIKVIYGPTASGKSAKAIELAIADGGVIINADSQQVYRELPILSAQPGPADMAKAPHRMYGVLSGEDRMDAFRWSEMAASEIRAAWEAGKTPYVVGGTGFYIKALAQGLSVVPAIPRPIRDMVRKQGLKSKISELYEILKGYDPDLATRINPHDKQRILRGIETFRATGMPLSSWQRQRKIKPFPEAEFEFFAVDFPMDELERRIEARTDAMIKAGVVDEVRAMLAMGYPEGAPIYKIIGVDAVSAHIGGKMSAGDMRAAIVLATRQYAKRQRTFFRTQMEHAQNPPPPAGAVA
ncbi:MAG: tRNA (adenosine(37)-N6)-dimethylallyltransferase MiaA [Rickettsiales bacterium]|jgi:tRNA dimethylallyltransferase|nr:tRNA (adenosine(37)-N6)-dimethylallyltransferase MiaA [Rickettsiales bacterium]